MADGGPLIIAHRGASGYLPEHTLEAKALGHGLGADYLEQDVVATRDDRLVVLHDVRLDAVTDVARRFPARHRADGHFYARDFDLAELKTLNVHERRNPDGTAVFPNRFPTGQGRFRIATLEEELDLVQGLNRSTGRTAGIYTEIKRPAWHRAEGIDVSAKVLRLLDERGFAKRTDPVYLQCFDADELRRIRQDLGSDLKLIQLIGENSWGESGTDYDELRTPAGLNALSDTVDGIGPWLNHLYALADIDGQPVSSGMASEAHRAGLAVHPYTFRADALPSGFASFDDLVAWFVSVLEIDGLFTDFPDLARRVTTTLPATATRS